jgi:autotransporter-associated beta strand protein
MKSHSPLHRRLIALAVCAGAFLAPTSRVAAADGTWTNPTGGAWTNTNNWSGFVVPGGLDSVANFASVDITTNSTVTNSTTGTLIGTFLFGDTSGSQTWGVTGGAFTLATSSGSPTISNGVTTTFNSALEGTNGLLKTGSAVLIIGGSNTYSGNTTISQGALRLNATDVLPDNSVVVFANNTNSKELTVFSQTDTIGGVSSSGGAGTLLLQNNRATNSGTLNLSVAAATSLTYDGIIRDSAAGVAVNNLNIIKSGTGTQVFSGGANVNYSGATTVSNGVLEFAGATVNNSTAIDVAGSNAVIRFNIATGNLVRTNTISGAGGLVKVGTNSALTFSNANTYTGMTVLAEGFIRLGASDRLADTSVLQFATTNDARFQMQGFSETLGGLDSSSSSGTQVIEGATNAAATLTLSVGSASYTYSGFLRDAASGTNANNLSLVKNGAGTQVLSGNTSYSGATTINGGTLEFAAGVVNNNSAINVAGSSAIIRFSNDTNSVTRSNSISGLGALEKSGTGTLILSASNSYGGNTTVNNGVLRLATNGSLRFVIGGSGTNNQLRGSGTVQLEGRLFMDLAGASTNTNSSWTIVSNSLTTTYGTNFLVNGFSGSGGNWTNTTNGVNYVFAQSNGVLSVQSTNPVGNYSSWVAYWTNLYPGFTNTAGTDNPDGDPFDNNEEFAFDGNPTVGSPALLTAVKSGTNTVFNYVARKNPPGGVTYQVQATTNLAAGPWTNASVTVSNSANTDGLNIPADYERKEFIVPVPGQQFFRVQAIIAP